MPEVLGKDSDVACVGPKCLEDRGECVLTVQPASPLIMEIKLAQNRIKSGTTGSYCDWFPLSPFNNFISISTSDDMS